MNVDDQRKLAFRLAKQAGALKTLETIKDPKACYETILKTAASEGGVDRLIDAVLQNDPWWAYKMLTFFPDLGEKREALLKKAAEDPQSALHAYRFVSGLDAGHQEMLQAASAGLDAPVATIYGYEMDQTGPYSSYFGVKWIHNGVVYPSNDVWNDKWDFDGSFSQGQYHKMNPDDFAGSLGLPISDGDVMWPCMHAMAGQSMESATRFIYRMFTTSVTRAQFVAGGTVDSITLDYKGTYTT